jgi:hypothetical protein
MSKVDMEKRWPSTTTLILPAFRIFQRNTFETSFTSGKLLTSCEDCILLWATEVSVSQMKKYMMGRLSNYMKDCKDLLTISLVDVKEVEKHAGPQSGLEVIEILEGKPSVSTFSEWLSYKVTDNEDSIIMETFSHTWQHSITATITIWLCHPDGSFNINNESPNVCATAVHCWSYPSVQFLTVYIPYFLGTIVLKMLTTFFDVL